MQFRLPLIACVASMAMAIECTQSDISPFTESAIACVKATNLKSSDLADPDAATVIKICNNKECKAYFAKLQTLTCTIKGQSSGLAASQCATISDATSGTTSNTTPGASSSTTSHATTYVVASLAMVVSTAMLFM